MKRRPQIDTLGLVGTYLDRYYIKEIVSSGGMGTVYRAQHKFTGYDVAVKVLHSTLAADQKITNLPYYKESTTASLKHPSIVPVTDTWYEEGLAFMVMEWVDGRTLEEELSENGRLPVECVADLLDQICDAVAYAHSCGIILRDLKPSSLMLTENGAIKIMDFGIARVLGSSQMTRIGRITGTIEYMSPEQAHGQKTDARSDIYSLGIVLYEMLTGQVPFDADSVREMIALHNAAPPPPMRQICPFIPQAIEDVVLKALGKQPEDRYQTALELAHAFRRAANLASETLAFTWIDTLKLLIVRFARWAGWLSSLDQDVLDEYINFQERRAVQHAVL
jgi:serine/threonine-protein kinase